MNLGRLYLIPNTLGSNDEPRYLPPSVAEAINLCQGFIVESHKMSRRLIKLLDPTLDLNDLEFFVLSKRPDDFEDQEMIAPLLAGKNLGLISDAGLPAVADPGSRIVALAHRRGIVVMPCVGPSSIMMALMASGLNGQQFTFHGYVTNKKTALKAQLKRLENLAWKSRSTQIFIETPYRNLAMSEALMAALSAETLLCVACDLTLPTQWIASKSIAQWRETKLPDLHKRPCIFLIGCP